MIEASQRMINEQLNSPPVNEHFKLQIKTLQNEAMHIEDTQRLVTEIEMLHVVLYLVNRNHRQQ